MTTQALQPVNDVYDILQSATNDNLESVVSQVVDLCHRFRNDYACAPLPMNMQGELLEKTRQHFFELECRIEKKKARELIKTREPLDSYFFWSDYQALIDSEWKIITAHAEELGKNPNDLRFAFIGSGAMPVSALLLSERTKHPVVCVDSDPEANEIAQNFLRMIGREEMLVINESYAQSYDYSEIDVVFMASLIKPKSDVLSHIRSFDVSAVLARSVCEGFCMIYEALADDLIHGAGFKVANKAEPTQGCMHQTMLLSIDT